MNPLIENHYIREMDCGSNISFILSDNSTFSSTEYKVLQNQSGNGLVKCMKMMYNGKVQLYYLTTSLTPLASVISDLDADRFLIVVSNLLSEIIKVKHNGFLSCQNIDISFERIFVDPATLKVSLVYLPLSSHVHNDNSSFENEIRTGLVKLISGVSALSSSKTMQLYADLSDGTLSMEDLYARIKCSKTFYTNQAEIPRRQHTSSGSLRIIAIDTPVRVTFVINSNEFIIGKKAELCDGIIDFNKLISRRHCKITKQGGQYMITDLQSSNGTYVNKVKLQPDLPYPIQHGDVIRLANSNFRVTVE